MQLVYISTNLLVLPHLSVCLSTVHQMKGKKEVKSGGVESWKVQPLCCLVIAMYICTTICALSESHVELISGQNTAFGQAHSRLFR